MKASRGFTLVEILVVVAVFGLLIGLIGAVAVLVQRYGRQSQQISEAQREVVACLRGVGSDLSFARGETWSKDNAEGYWFLSSRPPESQTSVPVFDSITGQLLWHTWVGVWRDAGGEVRRAEILLSGGAQIYNNVDLSSAPAAVTSFTVLPRRRVLARKIARLQMDLRGTICEVTAEAVTTNPGNPPTRYFATSSFPVH